MLPALSEAQKQFLVGELRRAASAAATFEGGASQESIAPRLYALLDASRDPAGIPPTIEALTDRHECLFRGRAREDYGDHAPWLVELTPQDDVLDWIIDEHFGLSRTSFVVSALPLRALSSHFRRFVKVRWDDGELVFYRFFDPFVIHQHLPLFTAEQRRTFMGPLISLHTEFDHTSIFTLRLLDDADIAYEKLTFPHTLPGGASPATPAEPRGASGDAPSRQTGRYPPPSFSTQGAETRPFLAFSTDQHRAMRDCAAIRSRYRVLDFLREAEPRERFDMPDGKLFDLVRYSEQTGQSIGVRTERGHTHWAYLVGLTEGRAATMPEVRAAILDGKDTPDANVEKLLRLGATVIARSGAPS